MKKFELPDFELVVLDISDIVTSSNPFDDENKDTNELVGWIWN